MCGERGSSLRHHATAGFSLYLPPANAIHNLTHPIHTLCVPLPPPPPQRFPEVITKLLSLKELNLDYAGPIRSVPPGIGELRHLEGLQMEGSELPSPLDVLYAAEPLQLVQVRLYT